MMTPATPKGKEVATTPKQQSGVVAYTVNGQEIVLHEQAVRMLTGDNKAITASEVGMFIELCKYSQLNPFIREAFLVKYGSSPAQMITSYSAILRKADENPEYAGIEDGIIIQNAKGEIIKREGCLVYNGETLVGGWAKVYNKRLKVPTYAELSLAEYDKKQSTWLTMKATLINKCSKVAALRKAFPATFSGLYLEEEIPKEQKTYQAVNVDEIGDDNKEPENTVVGDVVIGTFETEQPPTDSLDDLPNADEPQSTELQQALSFTLAFGKNKGKTLGQIENADKSYIDWLADKAENTEVKAAAEIIVANRN